MAIVVLNKTPYDSAILEKIILFACKVMGIAGGTTFVKITCKKSLGIGGVFTAGKPRLGNLRKKGLSLAARLSILDQVDSGWVHISVPTPSRLQWRSVFIVDAVVQDFPATLLHEFSHAADFKKNPHTYWGPQYQGYASARSWRRSRWKARPCEISAVRQTDRAPAKLEKNRTKTALLRELSAVSSVNHISSQGSRSRRSYFGHFPCTSCIPEKRLGSNFHIREITEQKS